jgi:hypothetical protein
MQYASACIFCCRAVAISVLFTPLSTFRFQPLSAVAFLAIDVDITFHYVTSQFSAFGSALADSALLGVPWRFSAISKLANLDIHRSHHCSQNYSQVSQRWQQHAAIHSNQHAQVVKPWGRQSHPITI